MRTQLIETRQMTDSRNGRMASILPSMEDVTEFVSRMSRVSTPMGYKAEENETGPDCYSAFLSKPSWIRTGVFKVTALTVTPTIIGKTDRYNTFLSKPSWIRTGIFGFSKTVDRAGASRGCIDGTWIRTGVFKMTALTETATLLGNTDRYNAFFSKPSWIRTGVFGPSEPRGSAVFPILMAFARTWITTGIFELVNPWGRQAEPIEESLRLAA